MHSLQFPATRSRRSHAATTARCLLRGRVHLSQRDVCSLRTHWSAAVPSATAPLSQTPHLLQPAPAAPQTFHTLPASQPASAQSLSPWQHQHSPGATQPLAR